MYGKLIIYVAMVVNLIVPKVIKSHMTMILGECSDVYAEMWIIWERAVVEMCEMNVHRL